MALQKQPFNINFSQGIDSKTDPKQVQFGKFLALQNSVFDKAGGLVKRNGFANITTLPNDQQTTLTTLNGNLIATGSSLYAFSANSASNQWLNQGSIQPVQLNTISMVRNSTSQSSPDSVSTAAGLTCIVYVDNSVAYYHIVDANTGYQVVQRTALESTAACPRVFLLGPYFIITYLLVSSLKYVVIPANNPTSPSNPLVWSASVSGLTAGYDGVISDGLSLYIMHANSTGGMDFQSLNSHLAFPQAPQTIVGHTATLVSVVEDEQSDVIYTTFYDGTTVWTASFSYLIVPILAVTSVQTVAINQLTSEASSSLLTVIYENTNSYGFTPSSGSTSPTSFISKVTVTSLGVVGTPAVIIRSLGLASQARIDEFGTIYLIGVFQEANQNTYFLLNTSGNIYMRLAATNAGGYAANQVLPTIEILDGRYTVPYLINDFLATVNKGTNLPSGTPVNAIYTQTGINLALFTLNVTGQYSSEISGVLNLTGGQLWQYDGVKPVEQGFHVFPSPNTATTVNNGAIKTATGSGSIAAGTYFYAFTYEWTDNQGNLHRSAPSIPVTQVTTTASSTNTIYVPTNRLTYKVSPNPIRIVGYRWSVAQQVYYQFTSITSPVLNNPAVDYVTITDTKSDLQILGQTLLYTTGGVVENICPPPSIHSTLFKNRLWLIDAEDRNLLWFSKQVIESTPVEMSDLLTVFVAPTTGSQGSTGPMTALSSMDDKLIIFKQNAIYYLTGSGPDITGANNDYSDATFITSAVGCENPNSIVLMPNGIMFQSDKGIWLLGRDLNTTYIGAAMERYNDSVVKAAQIIPGTNQVRFILDNNITLMYDYYYGQWGTFNNRFAISGTLYQGAHTYLSSYGNVLQETSGTYLDDTTPVLLSFTTSWANLAGIQGYERFYEGLLLGTYYTPFKLDVQIAYDYNVGASQSIIVTPDNYSPPWGGDPVWGANGPWGGPGNNFEARIFPERQKCESFQLTVNEVYDPSLGAAPGQGLSMSGINLIVGLKKGSRTSKAAQSFG